MGLDTWLVVADTTRARVFRADASGAVEEAALVTFRLGHEADEAGERAAYEIAGYLHEACSAELFGDLVVVAEARLLGSVLGQLEEQTAQHLRGAVPANVVGRPANARRCAREVDSARRATR